MDSVNASWFFTMSVPTFGNPRIEAYLQLPAAYRSLSRPSSAPDAKAFAPCSCSLELLQNILFRYSLLFSLRLNCCVSRFTVTFRLAKLFITYPTLERPDFHHIFSLCLLKSVRVLNSCIPVQFSMIVRRSEPASLIFIGLSGYSSSLKYPERRMNSA